MFSKILIFSLIKESSFKISPELDVNSSSIIEFVFVMQENILSF